MNKTWALSILEVPLPFVLFCFFNKKGYKMLYTELTKKAMLIAMHAHDGQVDKLGFPYIFHPIHLADQMETEDTCVVALLHDVLEDTDYRIEELKKVGFSDTQLEALRLMTHEQEIPYYDYVKRIASNPIAKIVKLADLAHNSDENRLAGLSADTREYLIKKYSKAIDILNRNE